MRFLQSLEEDLPKNFQNLTELTTKIGGKKIKIKDFINKATSNDGSKDLIQCFLIYSRRKWATWFLSY